METTLDIVLDVTLLEPKLKHPTIFARFDSLNEGETFIIHNDHDPKPLYYQLIGERGNIFNWVYIEQGPIWWKVQITKRNNNDSEETLGQIAAKDLRKAAIFKKYGLDFCCNGKRTLAQACSAKGLDYTLVAQELQNTENTQNMRPLLFNDWSLSFLADYIVNTHHAYVTKTLPDLRAYAHKVMKVHSDTHPELIKINELVVLVADELTTHMHKEEQILFPLIKQLEAAKNQNSSIETHSINRIKNAISVMELEHETAGDAMLQLRNITQDYTLPTDACASYSLLYRMLSDFEDDLHTHIHLENNILFPKALQLENTL